MGILISCQSIGKSYSGKTLFKDISFGIEDTEKIGLIGPNGSGKSTLLKIFARMTEPDEGEIVMRKNLRIAFLEQQDIFQPGKTIKQIVEESANDAAFVQHEREASIDSTMTKIAFPDIEATADSLSGGWRKRLSLACALVKQPDLLLLDEPTNHLDLDGVLWLEKLLKKTNISFVLVSHDRAFLENATNRIIELNAVYPQGFLSTKGNYSQFLQQQDEQLNAQQNMQQALASQVRREIAWLRQGAKARQTKSRGRIRDAGKLIDELAEVKQRNAMANAQIDIGFDASGRKTKELISAKSIAKNMGGRDLFHNLDLLLTSGSRLGLIGPNGSGKTTLLKLIIGQLEPDKGLIKRADNLKIVWFSQNREQLDLKQTLARALSPTSDTVLYQGKNFHISTWAKKFLFRPEQLHLAISYLSGGEQARIQIAKLMLQPADILILDEPTNDLDIPSLNVLEESLIEFSGAVIIVSHDRMLLSSVTNKILALDGQGEAEYFADYEQFVDLSAIKSANAKAEVKSATKQNSGDKRDKRKVGLSTAEKRELESIALQIENAENLVSQIEADIANSQSANYTVLQELNKKLKAAQKKIQQLFKRWEDLESKAEAKDT